MSENIVVVLGVDQSTVSSGICLLSYRGVVFSETITSQKHHTTGKKLVSQREGFLECVRKSKIYASDTGAELVAGLEDVYIKFSPKVYKSLCAVRGVFLEVLASEGIPCTDVSALSARKFILGTSHKSDKDKVFRTVNECFSGHFFRNKDETDAAAVAMFLFNKINRGAA